MAKRKTTAIKSEVLRLPVVSAGAEHLVIGYLMRRNILAYNGREGAREPEFYTLSQEFIRHHHDATSSWQKVRLPRTEIEALKNDEGFELIAAKLGVAKPMKTRQKTPSGAKRFTGRNRYD